MDKEKLNEVLNDLAEIPFDEKAFLRLKKAIEETDKLLPILENLEKQNELEGLTTFEVLSCLTVYGEIHEDITDTARAKIERILNKARELARAAESPNKVFFGPDTTALIITHPKLKGALLPQKNDNAYIINIDNQLKFTWDADGTPIITTVSEEKEINDLLDRQTIPADCTDTELLEIFASAVASSYICNTGYTITVDYPSFLSAMGTKPGSKKNHHTDPMKRIKRLENVGGVLVSQKKIQRVFVWLDFDDNDKTLIFQSPYLYSIINMLKKEPAKIAAERRNDRPKWTILGLSYLGRTTRASAKNKITVQIAEYLIVRLHERGNKTDAELNPGKTYKDKHGRTLNISYNDIIMNCPRLKEAIENTPKRTTQILQRSILGPKFDFNPKASGYKHETLIEEYLKKYFTVFDFWKDLKISVDPVTVKELNNKITFTHHGYNGDYKNPLRLPTVNGVAPEELNEETTENGKGGSV